MEFMRDAGARQFRVDAIHVLGRGILVFVAEETDHRTTDVLEFLEWRRTFAPGAHDAAAVKNDRATEHGEARGNEERHAPAHTMTHDNELARVDVRTLAKCRDGCFDVGDDLGVFQEILSLLRRYAVGGTVIDVR